MSAASALARITSAEPPPFALLHRPHVGDGRRVDVLIGDVRPAASLDRIPLRAARPPGAGPYDALVLLPYRQITERGFACVDDRAELLTLRVTEQAVAGLDDLPRPAGPALRLDAAGFDVDDAAYTAAARRIIDREIGSGQGANFVLRRSYRADITGYTPAHAYALFRNLLATESGAYWTFLISTPEVTLVGATPERHVSLASGTAVMNPISGTYRYGPDGPTRDGLLEFLDDRKEIDELSMVLDEELKMMARVCRAGGRVLGPELRQMARLAHTEYFIRGDTTRDVRDILRETMFAPTVVGSPLENACRVITRYEPDGRGYYSGVAALIGHEEGGRRDMDSAILIRTAEIAAGRVRIGAGATIVRHSDAASEAAETTAKISALLRALDGAPAARPDAAGPRRFDRDPRVRSALGGRNATVARFWLAGDPPPHRPGRARPPGCRMLIVDAEDTFTWMLRHQLSALGHRVEVRRYDDGCDTAGWDLVVLGPGPGDPGDDRDPKIRVLRRTARRLLAERRPMLAVCLSHQVLGGLLGFEVRRRPRPNQGVQLPVDLFGDVERVGFYNTFAAYSPAAKAEKPWGDVVEVSRDHRTGEVFGLRGPSFASMQFHPESILSTHGIDILERTVDRLRPG
ncbi:anthranilate synthase family protein [Actinoplanes sp. NPDC051411]|uniref:anthranilate synthase family protein n=1 Tax=Actinoplanes sp. NPDC051411 TaxID=3155522 RepID=UPI003430AE89